MATEPAEPTAPPQYPADLPALGRAAGRYEDCVVLKGGLANIDLTELANDFFPPKICVRIRRWHASTVRAIVQRRDWYADILGGS